ncbi:Argininosuccinate lyase [Cladobotryum mycophilum]|uniref:Arginosuccinase n=1 Tax=Cladobotryum mycophilum TaxID=491253 RepID=A0ABR0SH00_9HYPO
MPEAISIARKEPTAAQQYYLWPAQQQECKQFDDFLWTDLAHVVMLLEQNTISESTGRKLLPVLQELRDLGIDRLHIDPSKESLLFQVEAFLSKRLGDNVAGSLHTARSRIDQRATVGRMFYRALFLQVMDRIHDMQENLITAAIRHSGTVIPYYTHMQQAQPGNLGHYFMAFASKFQEDLERCRDAFNRVNRNPLGTVGRSGTGLRIDRERTTELLGFDESIQNSLLGRDADYAADMMAALSFVMYHLNDLATDLHIWSTNEFGFVQLPESYSATSSIFPQKRNPVTLEVIKFAAGPSTAWFSSTMATFRGEGTGDHKVHGSPYQLDSALDTTSNMLILAGKIIGALEIKETRIKQVLADSWSTTNNLADSLMQNHGLSIRQAHKVVARLVRKCKDNEIRRKDITSELLSESSFEVLGQDVDMTHEDLHLALDPESFVQTRVSAGGVGPLEVKRLIESGEEMLFENRQWVQRRREKMAKAQATLDDAIDEILNGMQ